MNSKRLFALACGLVVFTNIFVLFSVWQNRTAPADFKGVLTERELTLPWWSNKENSGLALRLHWRLYDDEVIGSSGSPPWLDDDKLRQLGYAIPSQADERRRQRSRRFLPREVLVVLEYDGPTYQKALAAAKRELADEEKALQEGEGSLKSRQEAVKRAQESLAAEQQQRSRLFAIDAGLDGQALRRKYPEQSRYLIAPALLRVRMSSYRQEPLARASISRLLVSKIHLPLRHKRQLERLLGPNPHRNGESKEPRYQVQLAYGRRYEPYVEGIEALQASP